MKNAFISDLLMGMNTFRQKPTSIEKTMETFKLALTRFKNKQNMEFIGEIEKFGKTLSSVKPIPTLKLNEELSQSAEAEVKNVSGDESYSHFLVGEQLRGKIPDKYVEQKCLLIADDGVDSPDNFLMKILMNREDPRRYGRSYLMDPNYLEVGMATKPGEDNDNDIVLIFCQHYEEDPQIELPDMDLTELKMAFDLFDVNKMKKIDPKETTKNMLAIGFNEKNPELFKIMQELEEKGNLIDFPTFAWHIVGKITDAESEEGLRTIFNLFVDDQRDETISIFALKRIVKELGEKEAEEEVNKLLDTKGAANVKLTFNQFYDFMTKIYQGEKPKKMELAKSQIKPKAAPSPTPSPSGRTRRTRK
ncbi:MAG: hypothetical protein MJ252_16040 [archaeon]|nr:hypothetical protein [archaeon]